MKQSTWLSILIIVNFIVSSCNNSGNEIPFPDDNNTTQPVTEPVHFSAAEKITCSDTENIQVTTQNLDFNNLPEKIFDSTGFKPFTKAPKVTHFNWDSLPGTNFNYNRLPSKPLKFKTSLLDAPATIHTGPPLLRRNTDNIILQYDGAQELTGNQVSNMMQDKNGFIWIFANNGLYRYDGVNLTVYIRGKFYDGSALFEDKYGQICMVAQFNFFILNTRNNTLKFIYPQLIGATYFYSAFADNENRIWLCTDAGLYIMDEDTRTIKKITSKQGLLGKYEYVALQAKNHEVWVGTDTTVNIIDIKKGSIRYINGKESQDVKNAFSISEDNIGNIWIGKRNKTAIIYNNADSIKTLDDKILFNTNNTSTYTFSIVHDKNNLTWLTSFIENEKEVANGICLVNLENNTCKNITTANGLAGDNVLALLADRYGQIWAGTNNGISVFNKGGNLIHHSGSEQISSLAGDAYKNIWIATYHGVDILNPYSNTVKTITRNKGLSNDTAQDIRMKNGKMFLTTNSGFDMIDSAGKTIQHITNRRQLNNKPSSTILEDNEGNLWICGKFRGIEVIDLKKNISYNIDVSPTLTDTFVYEIKQDAKGYIWFATQKSNVGVIYNNTFRYIKNIREQHSYNANICFDENGAVWVSSVSTIYRIGKQQDSISSLKLQGSLSDNYILSLTTHNNRLYAGTLSGIDILNPPASSGSNKWFIQQYKKSFGINRLGRSQRSDAVTADGTFLWGDVGITFFKDTTLQQAVAPPTYITSLDIFNQPQNFGSNTKDLMVNEDTVVGKDSTYLKGEIIHQHNTVGKNVRWDSTSGLYNLPVNLRLPYYENYIQFHFFQADFGIQDTVWYKYILEGIDKSWSLKTANPFSQNYLNLSPGSYRFKVASFFNGNWSEPQSLSFIILPPWWKTWWAYILYVLFFGALLWTLTAYRSRNLQRQNKLLEEKVEQRTNELNRSLTELKSTQAQLIQSEKMASLGELTAGIAHEIQNPLNFVNNFSEVNKELLVELNEEINKGNYDDAKAITKDIIDNEEKISHHGKRADAIVKGMLQHSRQTKSVKEPTDINALCDEYLRLSYHGLRAKNKDFNADFKTDFYEGIGKINIVPQDIGRVLLNLFNNAFYAVNQRNQQLSANSYYPTVSVQTKKLNDKVEIRIEDNGNGVPPNIIDKIFQPFFTTKPTGQGTGLGLSLAYDIITKEHSGTIKVESIESEGSVFTIQL